jgi:4a-hydroxytetrahydrobiopterin dehydratase
MAEQDQIEKLADGRIAELSQTVPGWMLGEDVISREFEFKDFREAMSFVDSVSELAEEHEHHPDIYISYNHVRLDLSTHRVGGLSEKDFALAVDVDRLL